MPTARKPPKRKAGAKATATPAAVAPPAATSKPAHRPPYEPSDKDRLTVKVMVAGGIEQPAIAAVLGLTPKTLRKHFRREIDTGAAEMHGRVVAALFVMATTGKNVHAAKWITQARMGWQERITVVDGGTEVDPAALSDTEIADRLAKLRRTPAVMRAAKTTGTVH